MHILQSQFCRNVQILKKLYVPRTLHTKLVRRVFQVCREIRRRCIVHGEFPYSSREISYQIIGASSKLQQVLAIETLKNPVKDSITRERKLSVVIVNWKGRRFLIVSRCKSLIKLPRLSEEVSRIFDRNIYICTTGSRRKNLRVKNPDIET